MFSSAVKPWSSVPFHPPLWHAGSRRRSGRHRHHRSRLAVSQGALAERSGLNRTYASRLERGERNIGLVNVYRLADALKISTAELLATTKTFRRCRRPDPPQGDRGRYPS